MAVSISQTAFALAPRCPASFLATGGTGPYVYSVLPGGAGGTINAVTGAYTAPATAFSSGPKLFDTIKAVDSLSAAATTQIQVSLPILLVVDIIRRELQLGLDRVYLWDQKINQPRNEGLYVAVSVESCKPFGNVNRFLGDTDTQEQWIAMQALVGVDLISRGPEARDRKEEVLIALNSDYSRRQQATNSFYIATLPTNFVNLSEVDGAAIPYRFRVSFQMQYAFVKTKPTEFFDTFETTTVTTDP